MFESAGTVIDGYTIVAPLGEGSASRVYRASAADGPDVVLKILDVRLARNPVMKERFMREARALNGLDHPHLIRLVDFGMHGDTPYLAMDFCEGQPLDELQREQPIPVGMAFELALGVVAGLAHAHSHGVLHRDIKPENVFVQRLPDGALHPRLIDFGLARFTNSERWGEHSTLTEEGTLIGTPTYMAPEQGFGKRADERSDVYSACVVLYELLAARPPFVSDSRAAVIRAHALTPVPPISEVRPGLVLQPALEDVFAMGLAKKAKERFHDAGALLRAMQDVPVPAARYL